MTTKIRWRTAPIILAIIIAVASLCVGSVRADSREPVAHWKLAGDGKDSSTNRLDAINQGVTFLAKRPDGKTHIATFDGISSRLEIKPAPALRLGTGDFTIALWAHIPDKLDDDLGDLVSLYDAKKRVGFNLSLRNNTGVTSCQANTRQLQFGIDAGSEPKWIDEGRPGNAVLAFALAVHEGNLYAGTASNAKSDVGRVFRYDGRSKWADCGFPDKCNAISSLAVFEGKLYAASSKYRFAGSALTESDNKNLGGGIYRFEGEKRWTEVGRLPDTEAVGGLVVYKGRFYASSLFKPAGFFRYEADGKWTSLAVPDGKRVESLGVFNGYLWATSYDGGRVYRYDGATWKDFGQLGDNSQTYSFAIYRGRLCVGTWPSGKVYALKEDKWEDLGRLGNELEVMGMLVHNGQLYAGTLPLAEVYRYDGGQTWTRTAQLDKTPDVKYRRAWTMAQYKGKLFCSTLPSGHIHSLEAGPYITHDRELDPGWHHIVAVKQGGTLRLHVDGKLVAESTRFDPAKFDLNTAESMFIGAGAGDFFKGAMSDVRLYRHALNSEEIGQLQAAISRPIPVGLTRQLFVDDYLVDTAADVKRELGKVTKANSGKPVFTDGWFYGTVLHDEGRFKLWYRKPGNTGFGYAQSKDGLSFEKKADLRGIPFAGDYTLAVEIDANEKDPKHRFMASYDAPGMAAGIARSADGITWTPLNDGKPVTHRAADTYNQVLWDPIAKTYRLFTRTDFGTAGGTEEIRGTRSMTNPDLKSNPTNWKLVREWIFDKAGKDEPKRRQIYATTCWIHEGVYFALLSVYEHPGDVGEGKITNTRKRHERDVMNFYVATSRDGAAWDLHWVYEGKPLVPRGADGTFDQDLILPASTIVTHNDKHWIYYAGGNERHGTEAVRFDRQHAIGLATLPLDRFVSRAAGEKQGTLVTKPFKLRGGKVAINVEAPSGMIAIEVLDEAGKPIASYSGSDAASAQRIDELRWHPTWKNNADLSSLKNQTIRFKFSLQNARLFAFQIK